MFLQSYIPPEYKNGNGYIENMKFQDITWGNEDMIFTTAQMTGKETVMYINRELEWHCVSWTFEKHTKMHNRHFHSIIGFIILLLKYLSYILH